MKSYHIKLENNKFTVTKWYSNRTKPVVKEYQNNPHLLKFFRSHITHKTQFSEWCYSNSWGM